MHDDIPKEDEDDAAFRRLRITLRVRPRRVAVPELQRIGTSLHLQKRTANSSSMHRSVSMAARPLLRLALALALANFFTTGTASLTPATTASERFEKEELLIGGQGSPWSWYVPNAFITLL